MGKDSFLIYKSFYKPISKLSDKQLGRLFRALFLFQLGEEVTIEEDIEIAFEFFKNQFEIDESKYQGIVERNRSNGRKGGAPKKVQSEADDLDEETQITHWDPKNPKKPKKPDNENENENDIKKEIASNDAIKKEGAIAPMSPVGDSQSIDYKHLVQFFNSELEKYGSLIPHIESIQNTRRNMVNARAKDHGKKAIKTVISKAATSPFLNGRNDRGFIASFDWIIRHSNFVKVLEGNYDDKLIANGNNRQVNSKESRAAAVQEQVARLLAEDDAKVRES